MPLAIPLLTADVWKTQLGIRPEVKIQLVLSRLKLADCGTVKVTFPTLVNVTEPVTYPISCGL